MDTFKLSKRTKLSRIFLHAPRAFEKETPAANAPCNANASSLREKKVIFIVEQEARSSMFTAVMFLRI